MTTVTDKKASKKPATPKVVKDQTPVVIGRCSIDELVDLAIEYSDTAKAVESRSSRMAKVVDQLQSALTEKGFDPKNGKYDGKAIPVGKTGIEISDLNLDVLNLARLTQERILLDIPNEEDAKERKNRALSQIRVELDRALPKSIKEYMTISFAAPTKKRDLWALKVLLKQKASRDPAKELQNLIAEFGAEKMGEVIKANKELAAFIK